jgi:hypothetical protein
MPWPTGIPCGYATGCANISNAVGWKLEGTTMDTQQIVDQTRSQEALVE